MGSKAIALDEKDRNFSYFLAHSIKKKVTARRHCGWVMCQHLSNISRRNSVSFSYALNCHDGRAHRSRLPTVKQSRLWPSWIWLAPHLPWPFRKEQGKSPQGFTAIGLRAASLSPNTPQPRQRNPRERPSLYGHLKSLSVPPESHQHQAPGPQSGTAVLLLRQEASDLFLRQKRSVEKHSWQKSQRKVNVKDPGKKKQHEVVTPQHKPWKWDKARPSALLLHGANKLFLQEEQEFFSAKRKAEQIKSSVLQLYKANVSLSNVVSVIWEQKWNLQHVSCLSCKCFEDRRVSVHWYHATSVTEFISKSLLEVME